MLSCRLGSAPSAVKRFPFLASFAVFADQRFRISIWLKNLRMIWAISLSGFFAVTAHASALLMNTAFAVNAESRTREIWSRHKIAERFYLCMN
jgi:hypothetical protein